MSLSLADAFYLKALDSYPYDLEHTSENLNYALSYNEDHAQANCLMGRMYMEIIKDYEKASFFFDRALVCDLNYVETYQWYSLLSITKGEYEKADRIIQHAHKVKGINLSILMHQKALIYEAKGNFIMAKKMISHAIQSTLSTEMTMSLQLELSRVKEKVKTKNKNRKQFLGLSKKMFLFATRG